MPAKLCRRIGLLLQLLDLLLLQPLLRCFLSLMRELFSLLRPQPGLELSGLRLAASWVP